MDRTSSTQQRHTNRFVHIIDGLFLLQMFRNRKMEGHNGFPLHTKSSRNFKLFLNTKIINKIRGGDLRYKKFILWLIIFFGYLGFLHLFSTPVETSASGTIKEGVSGGPVVVPGVSNIVSVQIIRAPREYWLGIIKAPAYVLGMNIDSLNHLVIDYAMPLLLLIFIIWEVIIHFRKEGMGSAFVDLKELKRVEFAKSIEMEGKNMNKNILMFLTKSLGIGVLLAFITFLLGDSPALAVLLLVIYMEIRFRKKEKFI